MEDNVQCDAEAGFPQWRRARWHRVTFTLDLALKGL